MPQKTMTPSAPLIQGIQSPNVDVNPQLFYEATRKLRFRMQPFTEFNGLGSSDTVQLRQTGIVAGLEVRVKGQIEFGGTITNTVMSYEWPFNLVKNFRLSANGQSNLISARGLVIRALEFVMNPKIDDVGLGKPFGAGTPTSGTLALPSDDWGTQSTNLLGPGVTVPATGTYTFDITYFIPVAADPVSLIGSIYAQSSATNLQLDIQWATQSDLLTLGGSATLDDFSVQWQATGVVYSIPNVGGRYLVPDLSMFHQLAEHRQGIAAAGLAEPLLPGTGVGRHLLRLLWNVYSSNTPLALTDANFSTVGWAYGGNDVPESYAGGSDLRASQIRVAGVDLGGQWGLALWDFASQFALRDTVDEGSTADLRLQIGLVNSPTSGYAMITQETLFAAPVGA